MIELNGNKFAKTDSEFIDSLFDSGGTCYGFYKQYKNRIIFEDMQHKPFAALVHNRDGNHFVSCTNTDKGIFYGFAMTNPDEDTFGLAGLGYMDQCEYIDKLATKLL